MSNESSVSRARPLAIALMQTDSPVEARLLKLAAQRTEHGNAWEENPLTVSARAIARLREADIFDDLPREDKDAIGRLERLLTVPDAPTSPSFEVTRAPPSVANLTPNREVADRSKRVKI